MVVSCDFEVRPHETELSPQERASARDAFVREFERQFNDWVGIAKCCSDVDRDRDWEILGFSSWHAWILDAAPRSRSYIYLVVGRYKELAPDIPDAELERIPLGSAGILRQLSPAVRQDSKIRKAAQMRPSEFRQVIATEYPNQHVEPVVECRLRFVLSAWERIQAAYEAYKVLDESASLETFLEWAVSETL